MIKLNLSRAFHARGIEKPHEFLFKNGFSRVKASRLVNSKQATISFQTLGELCVVLHCTPNDLFTWNSSDPRAITEDHPLKRLTPSSSISPLYKIKDLMLHKPELVQSFLDTVE
ncbi:MAG: helix-turn-helix transcriptional regulator [Cyclobacteriaceae bacterium]